MIVQNTGNAKEWSHSKEHRPQNYFFELHVIHWLIELSGIHFKKVETLILNFWKNYFILLKEAFGVLHGPVSIFLPGANLGSQSVFLEKKIFFLECPSDLPVESLFSAFGPINLSATSNKKAEWRPKRRPGTSGSIPSLQRIWVNSTVPNQFLREIKHKSCSSFFWKQNKLSLRNQPGN